MIDHLNKFNLGLKEVRVKIIKSISSEGGVGGIRGYATLVVRVPGHHDVATHTPSRTPAIIET